MTLEQSERNLVWIDLEMTGLDPDSDRIIEIATIVTDADLTELVEGPVMAVCQDETVLAGMDDWNTRQHTGSGLVERVRQSTYDEAAAERVTLEFIERYVPPRISPMCGNSICQDRRFLHRYMPALEQYFHYRNLDVSTVKELVDRWMPEIRAPEKQSAHLALDDIRESIDELRHYRRHLFKLP